MTDLGRQQLLPIYPPADIFVPGDETLDALRDAKGQLFSREYDVVQDGERGMRISDFSPTPQTHVFIPSGQTLDVLRASDDLLFSKHYNVDLDGTKGMMMSIAEATHGIIIDLDPSDDFVNATGFAIQPLTKDQQASLKNTGAIEFGDQAQFYTLQA